MFQSRIKQRSILGVVARAFSPTCAFSRQRQHIPEFEASHTCKASSSLDKPTVTWIVLEIVPPHREWPRKSTPGLQTATLQMHCMQPPASQRNPRERVSNAIIRGIQGELFLLCRAKSLSSRPTFLPLSRGVSFSSPLFLMCITDLIPPALCCMC